jgi:hypothetical protein
VRESSNTVHCSHRRKTEINQKIVGGLPLGDRRQSNKKAYGEVDGPYIGFMDDLTPCRVKISTLNRPWFRLNTQFMDFRKNRCFSGPPTHWGYCAGDMQSAKKLFFWYALARTFTQRPYPMWVDSDDMWQPSIPAVLEKGVYQTAFALAFAENECVETYFPANNPAKGTPELFVGNPMTSANPSSFWSTDLQPFVNDNPQPMVKNLVSAVDAMFQNWKRLLRGGSEIPISFTRPYFVDCRGLTKAAGLIQIKDYAAENGVTSLLANWKDVQENLKKLKDGFFELVNGSDGLNYFGATVRSSIHPSPPERTKFEQTLCRRLAVAGVLVQTLHDEPNFGRRGLLRKHPPCRAITVGSARS